MREKLTAKVVANATASSREYQIMDLEVPGFGLRVRASGTKSYFLQYRRSGQLNRCTIGKDPDITPLEAREIARSMRGYVAKGEDPRQATARPAAPMTIASLCDLYLQDGCQDKKETTLSTDEGRIKRHIKPLIGKKLVSEFTQADARQFLNDIARGKSARDEKTGLRGRSIVRGGKGTASRTLDLLGGIFTFAVERSLCAANPVRGVKRFKDQKNERYLSEEEINRLGHALDQIDPLPADIIRLLLLTGCRRNEIVQLRWSEVDFDRAMLRLADSKTGARPILLGDAAMALLQSRPKTDSVFVFPGTAPKTPYGSLPRAWEKVRQLAGLEDVRLHDLRHSFASLAVNSGASLPMIGSLLGHSSTQTTQRYAHLGESPVRRVADEVSRNASQALRGLPNGESEANPTANSQIEEKHEKYRDC